MSISLALFSSPRPLLGVALLALVACKGNGNGNDDDSGTNSDGTGDIRLDGGDALDVDPDSTDLAFCGQGDLLTVAWVDDRSGTLDVWVNHSADAGATWLDAPVNVSESSGDAYNPAIACSGGAAYLVWEDSGGDELGNDGIRVAASSDGGGSWGNPVALTADSETAHDANDPAIAARDGKVVVTWAANPGGGYDIYTAFSGDRAANFDPAARVESDTPGAAYSARPQVAMLDGDAVRVVWEDRRTGVMTIHEARSGNAGASFGNDRAVSDDSLGDAFNVRLAVDGTDAFAVWHQGPVGDRLDIYGAWATDTGSGFATATRISGGAIGEQDDLRPRVAVDNGLAHVVWYSEGGGGYHVFYRALDDSGPLADPFRIDHADDAVRADRPTLAKGGGNLAIGWEDNRDSAGENHDLYLATSRDAGASWDGDHRVSGVPRGGTAQTDLHLAVTADQVFSVWTDDRNTTSNVYFASYDIPAQEPDTGGAR